MQLVPSFQRRGAELFAALLARELRRAGSTNRLVSLFPGEDRIGASALAGTVCLPRVRSPLGVVGALRREYRGFAPDVVLAHGGDPFRYAVAARGWRAQPLIVYRKIGLTAPWLRFWRPLRLALHRRLMRRADWICCVAEQARREVIQLLRVPPERVSVIYGGVDQQTFASLPGRDAARLALGIPAHRAVLIGVGALGWEKHQEAMLRVLSAIRRAVPGALLLLAGEGPERGRLERLAADLGLADAVRFLGSRADVPALLAASDVFLLTSLTEGLPGVLVEAGMAGVPAVAWDVAGVREVVEDGVTGLVPPYRDERAFGAAVLRLLGDPASARRMGAAARDFCGERFSMERCVAEHLRLFRELLGGRG